jgi:hypothetical protein
MFSRESSPVTLEAAPRQTLVEEKYLEVGDYTIYYIRPISGYSPDLSVLPKAMKRLDEIKFGAYALLHQGANGQDVVCTWNHDELETDQDIEEYLTEHRVPRDVIYQLQTYDSPISSLVSAQERIRQGTYQYPEPLPADACTTIYDDGRLQIVRITCPDRTYEWAEGSALAQFFAPNDVPITESVYYIIDSDDGKIRKDFSSRQRYIDNYLRKDSRFRNSFERIYGEDRFSNCLEALLADMQKQSSTVRSIQRG